MSFATYYLSRFAQYPPQIQVPPFFDVSIIIVIPCYKEPYLLASLQALKNCLPTKNIVEVIIVINSSEAANSEAKIVNSETLIATTDWISENTTEKQKFYVIYQPNLPHKFAGVGLARKIGMDEAIRRFDMLGKPDGIIVGFDADSLCDENYLVEIENYFSANPKINACSIFFEHPIDGKEFTENIYKRIVQYELYLRYYINSLRFIKFPYSFQTIGSSFAVRASVYTKQGGMNRRQAGEDFYFLHKVIPLGNYGEINTTRVIPSPRPSDRVPFGTGAAIMKLTSELNSDYLTYNFQAFKDLECLFANRQLFFKQNNLTISFTEISNPVQIFLQENNFYTELIQINKNSPNEKIFSKRFFDWFDAFRVLKFLNFAHEKFYQKLPIFEMAKLLAKELNITDKFESEKEILLFFRNYDKYNFYATPLK